MGEFTFNELVLFRQRNWCEKWDVAYYAYEYNDCIVMVGGNKYTKDYYDFLPYKGNEYLLGTKDKPRPKWEPKKGEVVKVKDLETDDWFYTKFNSIDVNGRYISESMRGELYNWKYCEPLTDKEKGNV